MIKRYPFSQNEKEMYVRVGLEAMDVMKCRRLTRIWQWSGTGLFIERAWLRQKKLLHDNWKHPSEVSHISTEVLTRRGINEEVLSYIIPRTQLPLSPDLSLSSLPSYLSLSTCPLFFSLLFFSSPSFFRSQYLLPPLWCRTPFYLVSVAFFFYGAPLSVGNVLCSSVVIWTI